MRMAMFNPADVLSKAFKNYFQRSSKGAVDLKKHEQAKLLPQSQKTGQLPEQASSKQDSASAANKLELNPLDLLSKKIQQGLAVFSPKRVNKSGSEAYSKNLANVDLIRHKLAEALTHNKGNKEVQDSQAQFYQQLINTVEASIDQSKELLQKIGQLNDKLAKEINGVADDLVADLKKELNQAPKVRHTLNSDAVINSQVQSQSSHALGSIKIQTQQGDQVELFFHRASSYESRQEFNTVGQSKSINASFSIQDEFHVGVQGDLNQQERRAIEDLLIQVRQLAEKFFDGDVQQALSNVGELKIDAAMISHVALDFSYQQSSQQITAYQTVQNITNARGSETDALGNPSLLADNESAIEKVLDLVKSLYELLNDEELNKRFENQEKLVAELFEFMVNVSQSQQKALFANDGIEEFEQGLESLRQLLPSLRLHET